MSSVAKNNKFNYAFIDSQNLNLEIQRLGWKLDFKRFKVYLKDKYKAEKVFLFIGYIKENKVLYRFLKKCGYILIFKQIIKDNNGKIKGNVDAELVLQSMIEYNNYDKAIIVSSDGDFNCLIKYLLKKNKLLVLLAPNFYKCSVLLKKTLFSTDPKKYIVFLNRLKNKLEYKKTRPERPGCF
ncbi:NYN domain-containing protein [Candidatus Parcubacteria bacterium]|nr:NYN domain-containing protein [Candidatus Parcubacteria bacterium]